MNNIIIQGEHPVFWKTCAEEIALIDGDYSDELEEYICWHGLRHKQARIHLGLSDNLKAVRLYNRMFISDWPEEVFPRLEELGLKTANNTSDEEYLQRLKDFFNHCYQGSMKNQKSYAVRGEFLMGAGAPCPIVTTEAEQQQWFRDRDWERIRTFKGKWKGNAALDFIAMKDTIALFNYLHVFSFQTDEQQCAVIKLENSSLTWFLCQQQFLGIPAQRLIWESGNEALWKKVLIFTYMDDYRFVRHFGCANNWIAKLKENFNRIKNCPPEDLPQRLNEIR